MQVIITGASGFVGRSLTDYLARAGHSVTALVYPPPAVPLSQHGVRCITASLDDLPHLGAAELGSADVLVHLAWAGTAGALRADVPLQLKNVQGAVDAARLAKRLGCRRFVHAGSIMEYESIAAVLRDGASPAGSVTYSVAKLASDMMARIACTSLELSYANLIISNIYGKGESSPRLLNTLIRKMMRGEPADLTEGRQLYDFIYIDDAVRAIAQGIMDDEEGASYYIGNEQQRPLREWIEEMKDALSSTSVLNFGVIPFDGAMLTYREFDHTRLHRKGFVPQVSFSEGVQRTRDWLLEVEG